MEISIGTCSTNKMALNKDFNAAVSLNGTLRNETNVVNPSIVIQANLSTIAACNYMYIPAFHRYYYITDIRSINKDLCEVSGHCDVLMTYKAGIRTNRAVVGRSATQGNWNLYLNDPLVKVTSKSDIIVKQGWTEFPKNQYSLMLITLG